MNLYGDTEREHSRPGYSWRSTRVAAGEQMGATLYDLPLGERTFPYHYHHGIEEWLVVVSGTPTLRTPEGVRALREGDVVVFPVGPAGAHQVTGPGRVLLVSNLVWPNVSVYPDSEKLGTRTTREPDDPDRLNFPRGAAVDYWEGESGASNGSP
jgi:uncharacterized cupin superfamily protein